MTALVLAGSRAEGDALAVQAGVSHKALIDIGGRSMLQRVVSALAASPEVARVVVAIERPDIVSSLEECGKPLISLQAGAGPSASVEAALKAEGVPLLVTTADHPLLQPQWIREFLEGVPGEADVAVALARRETVQAAAPQTQRTYLKFADGDYSGCNLFLFRTTVADGVVRLWKEMEADRKRPLALLQRLGVRYALRYRLGRLTLGEALERLAELSGTRLAAVTLGDGRAAVDVDKAEDLVLVRRWMGNEQAN
jgi:GTP:adenosylcobinamide-phosphate guanylyltransferase